MELMSGFGISGFGFRISDFGHQVSGLLLGVSGFKFQDFGFRDFGYRGPDFRYRVWGDCLGSWVSSRRTQNSDRGRGKPWADMRPEDSPEEVMSGPDFRISIFGLVISGT